MKQLFPQSPLVDSVRTGLSIFLTAVILCGIPSVSGALVCRDLFPSVPQTASNLQLVSAYENSRQQQGIIFSSGVMSLFHALEKAGPTPDHAPIENPANEINSIAQRLHEARGSHDGPSFPKSLYFAKFLRNLLVEKQSRSRVSVYFAKTEMSKEMVPINLSLFDFTENNEHSVIIRLNENNGAGGFLTVVGADPQRPERIFVKDPATDDVWAAILQPVTMPHANIKTFRLQFERKNNRYLSAIIDSVITTQISFSAAESRLHQMLTLVPPAQFRQDILIRESNLLAHADKHTAFVFKDRHLQYMIDVDAFQRSEGPNIVYLNLPARRRAFKFNRVTGEVLILGYDGYFVSYFVFRGNTPMAKMRRFLNRAEQPQSEDRRP